MTEQLLHRIEVIEAENARLLDTLRWIGHEASRSMFVDDMDMLSALRAAARAAVATSPEEK